MLVLVPGILGSVLVKDGRELWGASGCSIAHCLLTFGHALKDLRLPMRTGSGDPRDGVSTPRLLPSLFMVPNFWKADGYGKLREQLLFRFNLTPASKEQPGNLIEFPYDWRLSNRLNGERLAARVIPNLERWQRHTNNRDAKLIFICHSMGGLVARWFLEVLGGRDVTRTLITIGTPYRGSVNALSGLVNGISRELGPIAVSVDELVRSFPSVYELLPTYACLNIGDGELRSLSGVDLPNVRDVDVQEGLEFHARISNAVENEPRYQTIAIKGVDQPTVQSALLSGMQVKALRAYRGTDLSGDGTVPRPSSHPPEWEHERSSIFVPQTHAMLQSTASILTQIFGALTGQLGRFMGGAAISIAIPDLVEIGDSVHVEAVSKDGDSTLPLHVVCQGEDGQHYGVPILMRATGDGIYRAKIDGLPTGAWRVTVQSATPTRSVEPVSDWLLVWNTDTN